MPVPTAAQAHQHMVINFRDVIDQKMIDAVVWASNGSRKDGLLHLTSDTVKRVFFAPAWNNRGGPDVKNPGLRSLLLCHYTEPIDIAWSWLYHPHGCSITGTFHRYSRGGNRSATIADWQGRARRLVQWTAPLTVATALTAMVANCTRAPVLSGSSNSNPTCSLSCLPGLLHIYIDARCLARCGRCRATIGYGSRAALWTNFGSEFRIFNGARTFQALLAWLAEEGHIIGDLASKKLKTFTVPNPVTHVQVSNDL